jgi:hypothetical protein
MKKNALALWALEKPEVSIRNFVADPQCPQANRERQKGKKIAATQRRATQRSS